MLAKRFNAILLVLSAIAIFTVGCGAGTIGPRPVKLSAELGDRISDMYVIHQRALENSFEYERARIDAVFKEKWIPTYLENQLTNSGLLKKLEQSEAPALLMSEWIVAVQAVIEFERKERLRPITASEKEIRSKLAQAYAEMLKANGVITARLEAAAEVKEVQDKFFDVFKVKVAEQPSAEHKKVADETINETISNTTTEK